MTDFLRARRPEQVEARRALILDTALAMLRERPIVDISLRELADQIGLAKSNVLRYFESREAIFLEILDLAWNRWLDNLAKALARNTPSRDTPSRYDRPDPGDRLKVPYPQETAVATTIASSLIHDPLLCELIAAMAGVLERNISLDVARTFKRQAAANTDRLAAIVHATVPKLTPGEATHFAGAILVVVAGLWPYAQPTDAVAMAMAEMGAPDPAEMFADGLTEGLINVLVGLAARRGPTGAR